MPRKRPAAPGETGYTKLADGRFRARRVIKGKAVFREGRTQKEAKARMDEAIEMARVHGEIVPAGKAGATLPEFVAMWLEAICPKSTDPKSSPTYTAYEFHARRLAAALPWKIREVSPADLLGLYKTFADRPRSAQYLHKTALRLMKDAVAWGYLERNTAALVPAPKYSAGEVCPPEPEELVKVLAAIDLPRANSVRSWVSKDNLRDFVVLMLHSGCRPSELIGLEWPDVNWSRSSITIAKTRDGKTGDVKPVKRKKSRREISLSVVAMDVLKRRSEGVEGAGAPLVFGNKMGGPLKVSNLRMGFKDLCKTVGLRSEYTLYDLRHTAATQMLAAGMPLHELSWRLGHSSVAVSADIYSHKIQRRDAVWAERLSDRLNGEVGFGEDTEVVSGGPIVR